jgi:hypothetical protein
MISISPPAGNSTTGSSGPTSLLVRGEIKRVESFIRNTLPRLSEVARLISPVGTDGDQSDLSLGGQRLGNSGTVTAGRLFGDRDPSLPIIFGPSSGLGGRIRLLVISPNRNPAAFRKAAEREQAARLTSGDWNRVRYPRAPFVSGNDNSAGSKSLALRRATQGNCQAAWFGTDSEIGAAGSKTGLALLDGRKPVGG